MPLCWTDDMLGLNDQVLLFLMVIARALFAQAHVSDILNSTRPFASGRRPYRKLSCPFIPVWVKIGHLFKPLKMTLLSVSKGRLES